MRCLQATLIVVFVIVRCGEPVDANPELVVDIRVGSSGSTPQNFVVYQDSLYFSADDGLHGHEYWKWDGATASLVRDLNPGSKWSEPSEPIVYDGTLYFTALHSSNYGRELWSWDGDTAQKLSSVEQVDIDAGGRGPKLAGIDGKIYFSGADWNYGQELWVWDNGNVSRKTDLTPGSLYSSVNELFIFKDNLYFSGSDGNSGVQIWTWNGTAARKAIQYPDGDSRWFGTLSYKVIGDLLYFSDTDDQRGQELWIWDGITYPTVIDILPGPGSSAPGNFTEHNGEVYFTASDPVHGRELWKWDGMNATLVADIRPGEVSSVPQGLTVFDGALYFSARDAQLGNELWKWDGVQATLVADMNPGPISDDIGNLTVFGNDLYFSATDPEHGRELWRLRAGFSIGGDFDNDGDVDGKDLLVWQRGNSPPPNSIAGLRVWQENYGAVSAPGPVHKLAVPEPKVLNHLVAALALLALRMPLPHSSTRQSAR